MTVNLGPTDGNKGRPGQQLGIEKSPPAKPEDSFQVACRLFEQYLTISTPFISLFPLVTDWNVED